MTGLAALHNLTSVELDDKLLSALVFGWTNAAPEDKGAVIEFFYELDLLDLEPRVWAELRAQDCLRVNVSKLADLLP
jgi:hypothetical protein